MATRGDLITRIISELHLEGMSRTADVISSINSAVDFYRPELFWFNEGETSFNLTATAMVSLPAFIPDAVRIDTLQVVENGTTYHLDPTSWNELEEIDRNDHTGTPNTYAIHHRMLRFYPSNDVTRTVNVSWAGRITMTASNSSSTVWTNDAEELIRTHAKVDLCESLLRDYEQADRLSMRLARILNQLMSETVKRLGIGRKLRGYL
jgi:hypothetical protein